MRQRPLVLQGNIRSQKLYYIVLGLITVGLYFVGVDEVNILLFFVSSIWIFVLEMPEIEKLLHQAKYRFSFLNIIFCGNNIVRENLSSRFPKIARFSHYILPFTFLSILVYITGVGSILFILFGPAVTTLIKLLR